MTVRAAAPVQLGAARITGADAASFSIVSDGCSGQSLPAGASCQVLVRFGAAAPGARTATLEIGPAQSALQGFNYGGRTRLDISGQPGDNGVEPPVFGAFTPPDSWFYVTGRDSAAGFYVAGRGSGWTGSFRAANGAPLAPGRYTGAQNNMYAAVPAAGAGDEHHNAWGYGDPCSSEVREFTINEITRYPDVATKSMESSSSAAARRRRARCWPPPRSRSASATPLRSRRG